MVVLTAVVMEKRMVVKLVHQKAVKKDQKMGDSKAVQRVGC